MTPSNPIPLSGILLALVALVAMFAMGIDPFLSIAVAVVWIGSLFLAVAPHPIRLS